MVEVATVVLGLVAVGALIYAVGINRSREAAARAGSGARSAATSGVAVGGAGAAVGLQYGNDLITAVLSEPGFALTAVAGVMGALGIEGALGGITGTQFLLIGFAAFVLVWVVFGGGDD
jgi:hypothetical protein